MQVTLSVFDDCITQVMTPKWLLRILGFRVKDLKAHYWLKFDPHCHISCCFGMCSSILMNLSETLLLDSKAF